MPSSRPGRVGVTWSVPRGLLTDRAVRRAVRAALAHGGRPGIDVEVVLVSDRKLAGLHGRFLGDPSRTDVISFDLGADGTGPAAEIYASVDRARAVARERRIPPDGELLLYVVHGALHLCGFDDVRPRDRARMRTAEARVLTALGAPSTPQRGTRGPIPYKKTGKTSRG